MRESSRVSSSTDFHWPRSFVRSEISTVNNGILSSENKYYLSLNISFFLINPASISPSSTLPAFRRYISYLSISNGGFSVSCQSCFRTDDCVCRLYGCIRMRSKISPCIRMGSNPSPGGFHKQWFQQFVTSVLPYSTMLMISMFPTSTV